MRLLPFMLVGLSCAPSPTVPQEPTPSGELEPECDPLSDENTCPRRAACVDGICASEGVVCVDDSGCGRNYRCVDGRCGGRDGLSCEVPEGRQCCSSANCAERESCEQFECRAARCDVRIDCELMYGFGPSCDESSECVGLGAGCVQYPNEAPTCISLSETCCEQEVAGCVTRLIFTTDGGTAAGCSFLGDCVDGYCQWGNAPPGGKDL
jgi:hypothetical protein